MQWFDRDAPDVGTGEAGSIDAGQMTRIQVRINRHTECIEDAVFKVLGDAAAVASAEFVTTRLRGAPLVEARELETFAIVAELQLPMHRAQVAGLAIEAAQKAIADWERKR